MIKGYGIVEEQFLLVFLRFGRHDFSGYVYPVAQCCGGRADGPVASPNNAIPTETFDRVFDEGQDRFFGDIARFAVGKESGYLAGYIAASS